MGIWRDAKRLEATMAGAGTSDVLLIARIVRAHWDRNRFEQIKLAYQQKYRKCEGLLQTLRKKCVRLLFFFFLVTFGQPSRAEFTRRQVGIIGTLC